MNRVGFDDIAAGAELSFVVRPEATGLMFDRIEIAAGPAGLHVEHPKFVTQGVPVIPSDPYADVTLDIEPEEIATLPASAVLIENTTGLIAVRFEVLEALDP